MSDDLVDFSLYMTKIHIQDLLQLHQIDAPWKWNTN